MPIIHMTVSRSLGVVAVTLLCVTAAPQAQAQSPKTDTPATAAAPAKQGNPAKAQVNNGAWCAHIRGTSGGGPPRCAYSTLEQCNKFLEGRRGLCERNPKMTTGAAKQ